jgi:hypothetical protein
MRPRSRRVLLTLAIGPLVALGLYVFVNTTQHIYRVPCGFRGPAVVVFDHPGGRGLESSFLGRRYTFRFDSEGVDRIRDAMPKDGWTAMKVVESCPAEKISAPLLFQNGTSTSSTGSIDWFAFGVNAEEDGERDRLEQKVVEDVNRARSAKAQGK